MLVEIVELIADPLFLRLVRRRASKHVVNVVKQFCLHLRAVATLVAVSVVVLVFGQQ